MSTGCSLRVHVLWITLQILVFACPGPRPIMADSHFTPYVSEFEYASSFHPSRNPDCQTGNFDEIDDAVERENYQSSRHRRSPEEGPPVGQEPSIEVRAILVRCPKTDEETNDILINRNIYNITAGRSQDILDFHGFDRDETMQHSEVRDCRRKLIVTMKFNNIGRTKTQEEFVVIDHVLDPVTMHKARLLNPFVVKVRQEPVLQLYGLKFQGVVNAEASEEVMSNRQSNYTGCDDTSENPTCGQMIYDGKRIPYSQGFCCSCDPDVNLQRQASSINETVVSSFPSFFSRNKDKPIRPFKSPRSVKTNFLDDPYDPEEIREFSSFKDSPDHILPHSNYESFVNGKNKDFQRNLPDSNFSAGINSDDVRDLINLKNSNTKSNISESSIAESNKFDLKTIPDSQDTADPISSSLLSKLTGAINEKPENIKQDSNGQVSDKMPKFGSRDEKFSKRRSTINIINELSKLEEDYKNFRMSSIIKEAERKDQARDKMRLMIEEGIPDKKYSDQGLKVEGDKFSSNGNSKLFAKDYDGKLISPSILMVPLDEIIQHRSTLSIDVKLAFVPRRKPTIRLVNSTVSSNVCSMKVNKPTTEDQTVSETSTIAVLWQKIASDRVYPSSEKNYFSPDSKIEKNHFSTEMTPYLDTKIDEDTGNPMSKLVISNEAKFPGKLSHSNDHQLPIDTNEDPSIPANSIRTIAINNMNNTPESTFIMITGDKDDFTTSYDEPTSTSQGKKFVNSSSSFSSGNETRNEAIVLSGSLRNQLGNWLTYDGSKKRKMRKKRKKKKSETRLVRKKLGENYDEKIEVESKKLDETKRITTKLNFYVKKQENSEDRTRRVRGDQKPLEIHLPSNYDHSPSNEVILPTARNKNEKSLQKASFDHSSDEKVVPGKKSKRAKSPRSYRSISEEDRYFVDENERQKNIDKRIEDEFEEISDVLKNADDVPKIVRKKPKSDETFENDETVLKKFSRIFKDIPKDIAKDNVTKNTEISDKIQTIVPQYKNIDPKIFHNPRDRLIVDGFKLRSNDESSNVGVEKFDKIVDKSPDIRRIIKQYPYHDTDRSERGEFFQNNRTQSGDSLKSFEETIEPKSGEHLTTGPRIIIDRFKLINDYKEMPHDNRKSDQKTISKGSTDMPKKIRDFREKEWKMEPPTILKNEFSVESISEMPRTTGYRIIIDRFKIATDFTEAPINDVDPSKIDQSNSSTFKNISRKSDEESTNSSLPNFRTPVLTIENLKKQLRNEAMHYSNLHNADEKAWNYGEEVREVNTQLTPAEKVEDLITEEETLPPDEETHRTTLQLSKTANIESFVTTQSFIIGQVAENSTFLPRFAVRSFQINVPRKKSPKISKKMNKVFILLEKSSPSSSLPLIRHFENNGGSKKRRHRRHRHRRENHDKKRLKKMQKNLKRNLQATKNENEDEEDPSNEGTLGKGSWSTASISSRVSKHRKRSYYHEIPLARENTHRNEQLFVIEPERRSSSGKMWLSITKIPVDGGLSSNGSLRIEETSRFIETPRKRISDRFMGPKSIFQRPTSMPSDQSFANDNAETTKDPEITIQGTERNLQFPYTSKFPSFYPRSSDIIAMSRNEHSVDRDDKRDDTMKAREALIFYDYEENDEGINVDRNNDEKRSLDLSNEKIDGIEPSEGWKDKMELLKLKKHADVLKEYLNWRHDVVPSPESHEIPDYTTKIAMTKVSPEETTVLVTTTSTSIETALPKTESTYAPETETFPMTIEETTLDAVTHQARLSTIKQKDLTEETTIFTTTEFSTVWSSSTVESSTIDNVTVTSLDSGNNENMAEGKVRYNHEESTGRILPCCNSAEQQILGEKFLKSYNRSNPSTPEVIDADRRVPSKIDKDLVIISLMEKNRHDKNSLDKSENSPVNIYKIRDEIKNPSKGRHRRQRVKSKNRKSVKRKKRLMGRRLMSVDFMDESLDDYEEDLRFDEIEDNSYPDSSKPEDSFARDSETLNRKWNDLVDKIVNENSSESWRFGNRTNSTDKPSAEDRTVLKKLHFYNADKYIKNIAKKIVRGSGISDFKEEKDAMRDKTKETIGKDISGRRNNGKKHSLVGRKLLQHLDDRATRLRFKLADYPENNEDSSRLHVVHKNDDSSVNSSREQSSSEGRDFAISLSGKIHVEGGINGQPMSISFDTSPDVYKKNETVASNETAITNATKIGPENPPNTNLISNLFNIAPTAKEHENNSSKDEKSPNGRRQYVRSNVEDRSRENHRKKYDRLARIMPKIRKSRNADPDTPKRLSKYRDDRSYDSEDSRINEDSEDYGGTFDDDDDEDDIQLDDDDDSSAVYLDRKSFDLGSDSSSNLSQEVQVIKVIPLTMSKSSRMTAAQLPKIPEEQIPGATVRPGKIMPAELPRRENDDEVADKFDSMVNNVSPKCPGPMSSRFNDATDAVPPDSRISNAEPINLKVIGLVSVGQPVINVPKSSSIDTDQNYEIVPLVQVKIQQQPVEAKDTDPNFMIPSRPDEHPKGCSKIDTSHPKDLPVDDSPCSRGNESPSRYEEEVTMGSPIVPTLNMDNDEELREPIQPCPEPDNTNVQSIPNISDNEKYDRIPSTEQIPRDEYRPCENGGKSSPMPNAQGTIRLGDSRKQIRMKNMLAILEFMRKINEIMSGDDATNIPSEDYQEAVIKLERVIIMPKNRTNEDQGCQSAGNPDEDSSRHEETTTDRVVLIGEGVKHPCGGISAKENSRFSETKEINDKASPNKLWKPSEKFIESPDKSFLFHGGNKPEDSIDDRVFSEGNNNETHSGTEEPNDTTPDSVVTILPDLLEASTEKSSQENETLREQSKSNERFALENFQRKIDDRLRDLKSEDSKNHGSTNRRRSKKRVRNGNENKRRNNDALSVFPKIKRHRSMKRHPGKRYKFRDERDAISNLHHEKPSSSSGDLSSVLDDPIGEISDDEENSGEERKKKKRKKLKKKRRRKKKRKKKKGKVGNEAMSRGKGWWPFGRQLMSFSGRKRGVFDSNFDQGQVEPARMKKRRIRAFPFALERRKSRRVHRVNYPRGKKKKKNKKHRKHKEGRRKKKRTKIKGEERKSSERAKRQIKPGGTQARGGQDCMDRRHPSNVDPTKYLESSHCLRFSDLWYSVYELGGPIMEHTVYLQLFEKHSLADGTTHWDDLTQGTMVRMGTFTRHQRDNKPTIVFTYSGAKVESQTRALNLEPTHQRLLIPSPVPPNKVSEYPANGPGEYLVVQTSSISKDGKECDKAGVGYAAFAKQEDRCGSVKGTCLKNQPLAYWRHDMKARDSGRRGCYFLSNFASVPTNPIKYNVSGTGSREYLGLEYHSTHVSAIDIEVRTDYNAIVRVGSSGRVTEVYVDSTSLEHTVVTVVISNMGLASSPYQPRITDCPTGLPVSWTKAKGIMQVIPPQHDQRVTLDLYGQLLLNDFHCSVEVVNHRGELVAMRRIRVQKMDRCFCVWHCLCACIGSVGGMGCQPMSPEHYHAAGFQGPVPVITTETSILMNTIKDVLMLSALLVLLLLLLGLLKWFAGTFSPTIGRWGLECLLEGSRIEKYLEPELRCRCVVTDDDGIPVHPDTGQRNVRLCSRKLEFVLNLIFFLTYPIAMCCSYFRRSLQSSRQHRCCPDESKMCLINEKSSCPKMICVSTYGDSRNSKLEAEDTRYVMNELKKSQESLQNPKGTKKKDGRKNDKILTKKTSQRNKAGSDMSAKRFVDELLKKRMVFRNLNEPIGGLDVPSGTSYSLRGYFLRAENSSYGFITPCPFKQTCQS